MSIEHEVAADGSIFLDVRREVVGSVHLNGTVQYRPGEQLDVSGLRVEGDPPETCKGQLSLSTTGVVAWLRDGEPWMTPVEAEVRRRLDEYLRAVRRFRSA